MVARCKLRPNLPQSSQGNLPQSSEIQTKNSFKSFDLNFEKSLETQLGEASPDI